MLPPIETIIFFPPDAQVEEQQKIQAEPEETKTSGTATMLSDKQESSKIEGVLQGSDTSTGPYYI